MTTRLHTEALSWTGVLAIALAAGSPRVSAIEELPEHQQKQIRDAVPARPRVTPKKARTVLIFNTPDHLYGKDPHKGYCVPYGSYAMQALGEKTGAYQPVVSSALAMFLPERIKQFDAVVLNNSAGAWITPSDADMERSEFRQLGADREAVEQVLRKSLLDFVADGGGLMAYHFATGANPGWAAYHELLGAKFTGHPWNEEVGIKVEDPPHPLVAAFGGRDFRIADEIYEFGGPYDREKLRVLMSLDTAKTNMNVPWIQRKDGDFAQSWVKPYGNGRVFYSGFGHRTELYWNPTILQFYLDAIQFACGDLNAPTAPRAMAEQGLDASSPRTPAGFTSLFDGKTLDGWQGDRSIWSVRDSAITGRTTADSKLRENNFLIWKDEIQDFELRVKFRLENGNSGIYYHAQARPNGETKGDPLVGTQADFDASGRWTGVIMEYLMRDVLAERGQKVLIDENGKRQVVGSVGDPAKLLQTVMPAAWNDYTVISHGGHVVLRINGVTMCELDDRDPRQLRRGRLALQVHVGPPMVVQFKDIYLRTK